MSDEELMHSIAIRVKGQKGIKFTALADQAQTSGRKKLAAMLLDLESNTAEQVHSALQTITAISFPCKLLSERASMTMLQVQIQQRGPDRALGLHLRSQDLFRHAGLSQEEQYGRQQCQNT